MRNKPGECHSSSISWRHSIDIVVTGKRFLNEGDIKKSSLFINLR